MDYHIHFSLVDGKVLMQIFPLVGNPYYEWAKDQTKRYLEGQK